MKKFYPVFLTLFAFFLINQEISAQYLMPTGGISKKVYTSGGTFYDNGGLSNDFTGLSYDTITFYPTDNNYLEITFDYIDMGYDSYLYIFNGPTAYESDYTFYYDLSTAIDYTASNPSGAITVVLLANTPAPGWSANIKTYNGFGPRVAVAVHPDKSQCKYSFWSDVLENKSNLNLNAIRYTNEWILDGTTYTDFSAPYLTINPGLHTYKYYAIDTYTDNQDTVGIASGSFFVDSMRIISGSGPQACPKEQVYFHLSKGVQSAKWNYDTTFYDNSSFHTFETAKLHTVKAAIIDACGYPDTLTYKINITNTAISKPEIMINGGNNFCPGEDITFNANGTYNNYLWDFGDGTTASGNKAVHKYLTRGDKTVTLKVQNICNVSQTGVNTNIVRIDTGFVPYAMFDTKYRYDYSCGISPIQFNTSGTGSYNWDFGDGQTSTLSNPLHMFPTVGYYTVTLKVTNACGKSSTYTNDVYSDMGSTSKKTYIKPKSTDGLIYNEDDTIVVCKGRTVELVNSSEIKEPVNYTWFINGTPSGTLSNCSVKSDITAKFVVKLLSVTSMCGTRDSAIMNVIFTDTIKPHTLLQTYPPSLCAGEKVYFFDRNFKPERKYVYDITTSDGDNITGITNLADLNLNALYAKTASQTFSYIFTARNECSNSITLKDTVRLNKDALGIPFYYVTNSSIPQDKVKRDYSMRYSPSDMEINVTVKMSAWTSSMDSSVYVYFFKDKYDSATSEPIGFVKAKGDLKTGVPVKAFLRYEPGMKTYGIAAAYYCDKSITDQYTSSRGIPGAYSYQFVPGSKTTLANINLNDPKCSTSKVVGTWHGMNTNGELMVATFYPDSTYSVSNIYNDYEYIQSQGTYIENLGIYYVDDSYCGTAAQYTFNVVGDTLFSTPYITDDCYNRSNALANIKFIKGDINKKDNYSSCPGDLIAFKAAGGNSYLWDFGDGTTAKEQYPIHSYSKPGKYLAKAIIGNACGRKDTVITPVQIDTINKPSYPYFYMDNYYITAGNTVKFFVEDMYKNNNISTKYEWYLDGKMFSADKNPFYTFVTPGYYTVKLKVLNGCGADSSSQPVLVEAATCYATFVTSNVGTLTYQFETPFKGAQKYTWTFDGTKTIDTSSSVIKYKFSQVAEHTINLKVTLVDGSTCEYTGYVNDASCDANFNSVSLLNKTIQFTGYSNSTSDIVNSWKWDFGDGKVDSGKTVTHIFPAIGYYKVTLYTKGKFCSSNISNWVYAEGAPCVQPTFTKVRTNASLLTFNIANPQTGVEYSWDFGDGSNYEYGSSLSHQFPYDDVFYVSVYSYDKINSCSDYYTDTVIIGNAGCMAYFSYYNDYDNHVQFYNYSSTGKYLWNFGDGSTSTESNPAHNYSQQGIYEVSLVVSDGSCSKKLSSTVVAGKFECQANFTYTVDASRNVTFKNASTGSPNSFYWYFDDWTSSNDENPPVHNYAKDGIYNVYFSVYNDITYCYDEIYKEIKIGDLSNLTSADFYWTYGADNKTIDFTNKSSSNVTSWYWTFGDGTSTSGANVSHPYKTAGIYNVCLTVYNSTNGTTDKKCYEVNVGETTCNVVASFTYMIDTKNDSVKFADKSTGKYDSWSWDFGDGSTSSQANPAHKYTTPGFYLVSLAVKLSNSYCIDYYADFIQVGTVDCKAEFSYVAASDGNVTFTNNSTTSGTANYYWYFDDGTYSTTTNPVHKFDNGMHYVFLTVADASGTCMDFKDEQIQVGDVECSAQFTPFVDIANLTVTCKNKTIGKSTDYYWYFGDGSVSSDTSPVHQFDYPGYYTISLTTFDETSWCMDNYETEVLVGTPGKDCKADFFYKVDNTAKKVKFSDNSKGEGLTYLWDFGDDTIPASTKIKDPEHPYKAGGYYNVCLTITNSQGVSNMSCKWIEVATDKYTDCVADFNYKVNSDKKLVKLVSKSLGNPTSYTWDFGDENQSTKKDSATHTYADTGYYLVTLNIKTADGCESNSYKLINVGKPNKQLSADFGYKAKHYDFKAGGYPVDFGGAGIGDNSRLRWNFGDGSENSTSMTPAHIYLNPGQYYVCFEYADSVSHQTVKSCKWITTEEKCQGDTIKPVAHCKDTTITITGAYLDIQPTAVDDSSTDDCGLSALALDNQRFYPANTGENIIHLTVTDYNNNKSTCNATVFVINGGDVKSFQVASGLKAYPNPIENVVTVMYNLHVNSNVDVAIYDLLGKRVTTIAKAEQQAGVKAIKYDASALKSGSYILQLKTSSGQASRLMVIKK